MPFHVDARRTARHRIQLEWQTILQATSLLVNTLTHSKYFTGIIAAQDMSSSPTSSCDVLMLLMSQVIPCTRHPCGFYSS